MFHGLSYLISALPTPKSRKSISYHSISFPLLCRTRLSHEGQAGDWWGNLPAAQSFLLCPRPTSQYVCSTAGFLQKPMICVGSHTVMLAVLFRDKLRDFTWRTVSLTEPLQTQEQRQQPLVLSLCCLCTCSLQTFLSHCNLPTAFLHPYGMHSYPSWEPSFGEDEICRTRYSLGSQTMVRPWAWLCNARLNSGGLGIWPSNCPNLGIE